MYLLSCQHSLLLNCRVRPYRTVPVRCHRAALRMVSAAQRRKLLHFGPAGTRSRKVHPS